MARSDLDKHIQDDPEFIKGFQQERLLLDVATLIYRTMKKAGRTRRELADSLNVSKGRISQYLGGERNLTLRTLADVFTALDSRLVLDVESLSSNLSDWETIPDLPSDISVATWRHQNWASSAETQFSEAS